MLHTFLKALAFISLFDMFVVCGLVFLYNVWLPLRVVVVLVASASLAGMVALVAS